MVCYYRHKYIRNFLLVSFSKQFQNHTLACRVQIMCFGILYKLKAKTIRPRLKQNCFGQNGTSFMKNKDELGLGVQVPHRCLLGSGRTYLSAVPLTFPSCSASRLPVRSLLCVQGSLCEMCSSLHLLQVGQALS